jgi:hypothetical protein
MNSAATELARENVEYLTLLLKDRVNRIEGRPTNIKKRQLRQQRTMTNGGATARQTASARRGALFLALAETGAL